MNTNMNSIVSKMNTISRATRRSSTCVLLLCGLIAALAGGCAEPVEDISYVQPHYVKKDLFQGEWKYKQTVVDMSPESPTGFVGLEGALEKVRWEITQWALIAYRTHEAIPGLDEDDTLDGKAFEGDPVAMFAIQSHFDIRRSYNAATGEQTNVITENTMDRPWFEREYMRVNWSSNMMAGPVDLSFLQMRSQFTDFIRETEIYDPDHLQLTPDYIQVTQQVTLSDGGYACYYLYGDPNCGSSEGRVRMSFAKIDPNDQYEPREYLDTYDLRDDEGKNLQRVSVWMPLGSFQTLRQFACTPEFLDYLNSNPRLRQRYQQSDCEEVAYNLFARFGFFRTERYRYDRRVGGGHDDNREFYAAIHNIWQDPYIIDADGTKRSKPFSQRLPKPIVYYLNAEFPSDLEHVAGQMANDWDAAFIGAVIAAMKGDDSDGDGLSDVWELTIGDGQIFDPNNPDTDGNGVSDGDEDHDGDGLTELEEHNASFVDGDGDGLWDEYEARTEGLDPQNADTDGDGLSDAFEDLDGDGDNEHAEQGYDVNALVSIRVREMLHAHTLESVGCTTPSCASWMFLHDPERAKAGMPTDYLKEQGMFQIRRNTCSKGGISHYLEKVARPTDLETLIASMEEIVETTGTSVQDRYRNVMQGLETGHLRRVCSGLSHFSRVLEIPTAFTWQRIGDVRFSMLNWINEPQPAGPLGYGPSSVDKETGEIYAGSANLYGASIDTYARAAADIVRAMNEDLDVNTLVSGQSYKEWLGDSQSFGNMPIQVTEEIDRDMRNRFGAFDIEEAYGPYHTDDGRIDVAAFDRQVRQRLTNPAPGDPMAKASRSGINEGQHRLDLMKKHPLIREKLLGDPYLDLGRVMLGLESKEDLSTEDEDALLDFGINRERFEQHRKEKFEFFADRNIFLAEFIDDSVIGQALSMREEDGWTPDLVYTTLREQIFRGVALHEIGHTVGMTHNFEGSNDALNYQDEFWDIRHNHDEADWNRQRLPEYRYSTIMDYGSRFNSDTKGLGKYDHAAIKFCYGHSTELFSKDIDVAPLLDREVLINGYQRIPDLVGGDHRNISKRDDRLIEKQISDMRAGLLANSEALMALDPGEDLNRNGILDPSEDTNGNGVLDEGEDRNGNGILDEAEDKDGDGIIKESDPGEPADFWVTREVPYSYCFDVFRGNLRCQVWDEGASFTETVRAAIQKYWNYYAFNNFRRGRFERSFVGGYSSGVSRLGWYLTTYFRFYYFYQNWNSGLRRDLQQAALIGLNFINQVLGTPLPGPHCRVAGTNQFVPYSMADADTQANCGDQIEIPVGSGREFAMQYSDDFLPLWDYIGSYWDKSSVIQFLSDTGGQFIRVSNIGDSRQFSIGYYRVFRDEIIKLLKSMMTSWLGEGQDDGAAYSAYLMNSGVVPKALVAPEAFNQAPADMEGMAQVYAPAGYNILFNALLRAVAFNTSTFDEELDFDEYLAIAELGSSDDRTYPEDWLTVRFVHPHHGTIYEAAQTRDGNSISYDLLGLAANFVGTVWKPAKDALDQAKSALASARNIAGSAAGNDPGVQQALQDMADARTAFDGAELRLGRFTDLISDLRLLRSFVDAGAD